MQRTPKGRISGRRVKPSGGPSRNRPVLRTTGRQRGSRCHTRVHSPPLAPPASAIDLMCPRRRVHLPHTPTQRRARESRLEHFSVQGPPLSGAVIRHCGARRVTPHVETPRPWGPLWDRKARKSPRLSQLRTRKRRRDASQVRPREGRGGASWATRWSGTEICKEQVVSRSRANLITERHASETALVWTASRCCVP